MQGVMLQHQVDLLHMINTQTLGSPVPIGTKGAPASASALTNYKVQKETCMKRRAVGVTKGSSSTMSIPAIPPPTCSLTAVTHTCSTLYIPVAHNT